MEFQTEGTAETAGLWKRKFAVFEDRNKEWEKIFQQTSGEPSKIFHHARGMARAVSISIHPLLQNLVLLPGWNSPDLPEPSHCV